jgi:hypothetical protein
MKARVRPIVLACTALAASLGLAEAAAQTLYKLIDRNGKVTYSESAPKDFDGQVVPMNIDPNANTATLPKPAAAAPAGRGDSDGPSRKPTITKEERVQAARDKLAGAKKALQDAIDNPKEGDITRMGTTKGFTRPVPSEDYQKRLAELEERVKKAEEELKVAERS